MSDYFCILTSIGEAKLANATALGQSLELSEMVLGDGDGSPVTPNQNQTSLVNQVRQAPLNTISIDENNANWIVCEQIIPADEGGWTIREIGILDSDGDLVAVSNFPATYKPLLSEGSGRTQVIQVSLQVTSAAAVTLKIDPAVVLATRKYVDDAKGSGQSHADDGDAATLASAKTYTDTASASVLSAAIASHKAMHPTLFAKRISQQPAFQMDAGTLKNAADLIVNVGGEMYTYSEGAGLLLPPSASVGTDFAIYATPDGLVVSANFTAPEGYTAETSRRVGGFHYQDGFINEYSLYDLKYRPSARDPRGAARSPQGIWADIYLLNTTPDLLGTSAHGAQIADGGSAPKVPAVWGGDGSAQYDDFSRYTAARVLAAFGKRLPFGYEFEQLAFGSTAGYNRGTDPVITEFNAAARSMIGCEGVSGVQWQWGAEMWDRGNGSRGYNWYAGDTNGEGQIYSGVGSEGVGASLFGGYWGNPESGPRCSGWSVEPWRSNSLIAARGVCDHFESC